MNPFWTEEKLTARIRELETLRYRFVTPLQGMTWTPSTNENGERPPVSADWQPLERGMHWAEHDGYRWIRIPVSVPSSWKTPVALFDFGCNSAGNTAGFESLLYIDGVPDQGVDANHREVFLPPQKSGRPLQFDFRLWSGLGGYDSHKIIEHTINRSDIALLDRPTDRLYYLADQIRGTIAQLEQSSAIRQDLLTALDQTFTLIDWAEPGSDAFYTDTARAVSALEDWCRKNKQAPSGANDLRITGIGHTHIDVAWLWRLRHTREKAARSFSTALKLINQYPEFYFLQTQPQLYEYIKNDYPDIYARIQAAAAAHKWETGGAMWLEADCNIPSGEALVRHLLTGTRFFQKEFGADCHYLWLPDVFGYSWALPQILKKSGITVFVTTKISWNQYNRMPHDTFMWRGIDGSEILTHFITTPDPSGTEGAFYYTYNGTISAETVFGIWNAYRDKDINRNLLIAYGHGDGGGGVTRDMIEATRALAVIPGAPHITTGRADTYFKELEETVRTTASRVSTWDGELYLELHRGTYTSQAALKRLNRKTELLLRRTELAAVTALLAAHTPYPAGPLDEAWKILLRNQFHDIIPGSAIHEVYEDAAEEFARAQTIASTVLTNSLDACSAPTAGDTGAAATCLLLDATGRKRETPVLLPSGCAGYTWYYENTPLELQQAPDGVYAAFPGLPGPGTAVITGQKTGSEAAPATPSPFTIRGRTIETPFYHIAWNQAGQLTSVYDTRAEREVLTPGTTGNVLQVFEDRPKSRHEAWDIDIYYQDKQEAVTDLMQCTTVADGPLFASVEFVWKYRSSLITQQLVVYAHSGRIDFRTQIDWHESRRLLKAAFPVHIRNTEATYDIQFGSIRRPTHWNTSWDLARFEVPAQQWADLSETGYGVSLLNDCKYGYDIHDSEMRLTLIKSAKVPDPDADQGMHYFTYALLPHTGTWIEGNTTGAAGELNDPVTAQLSLSGQNYTACCPFTVTSAAVCIDAVKQSESGDALILRIHEWQGSHTSLTIQAGFHVKTWQECNLLEQPSGTPVSGTDRITVPVAPFEIRTFRVTVA